MSDIRMKMAHPKTMHAVVPLFCMVDGCGCRLPGESFRSEKDSNIPKLGRITGGSPYLSAQGTWGSGTPIRARQTPKYCAVHEEACTGGNHILTGRPARTHG